MADYSIPLFDLNYGEEEIVAVCETLRSKWISMGPKCQELEDKFAKMMGSRFACAVTNCTAALHLACYSLGIGPGDEVICPSLTFAATVNCIHYVGATPVFCDIVSSEDLGIDPCQIESKITARTKAIIVMHYGGFPCDMNAVMDIAKKYNLMVIEDACHGPLSEYNGTKIGTIGDIGCFSFFSNKNISTGEGGMIITDDEELYQKVRLARSHGMTTLSYERSKGHATSYDIETLGFNYRMDDIRATLGCVQLDKLYSDIIKRSEVRQKYLDKLQNVESIIVPYSDVTGLVSNYIFPIVLKNSDSLYREQIRHKLAEKGIQTSVHYPAAHRFVINQQFASELQKTEYVSDNEITLPMYGKLRNDEIEYICEIIGKVCG